MLLKSKKTIFFILIFILVFFMIFNNLNKINHIIFSYPDNIEFAWDEMIKNKETIEKFKITYNNINIYQILNYIKSYNTYIPYIEEELLKNNMPTDLKYIPIVESSLNIKALSPAKAAWIWQFMPETAKEYWLIVDEYIDERYNFYKSTKASIKYFKKLYDRFWDRKLVIASYNRWQTAIAKALEDQNANNFYELKINKETTNYIYKVLAIKYIFQNIEENKPFLKRFFLNKKPKEIIEINWEIKDLKEWAKKNNYDYNFIKENNPWILSDYLYEWNWELIVK